MLKDFLEVNDENTSVETLAFESAMDMAELLGVEVEYVYENLAAVKEKVAKGKDRIIKALKGFIDWLKKKLTNLGNRISEKFKGDATINAALWGAIQSVIKQADAISKKADAAAKQILNGADKERDSKAAEGLAETMKKLKDGKQYKIISEITSGMQDLRGPSVGVNKGNAVKIVQEIVPDAKSLEDQVSKLEKTTGVDPNYLSVNKTQLDAIRAKLRALQVCIEYASSRK